MFAPLLLGAAVSGAATVGSMVQYYRRQLGAMTLADVRALAALPVTPIGQAQRGLVKLVGTLGCDTPILSLEGDAQVAARELHYYDVVGAGLRARKLRVRVERMPQPFWVEDETGRIGFDPATVRIDYEVVGADTESMLEEHRLRLGERVAVIGEVRRDVVVTDHPLRRSLVQGERGLHFVTAPLVTWRTEPEVYPRLGPPVGGLALSAGTVGMAILGAILRM